MHRKPVRIWRGAVFVFVVLAGLHWLNQLFMSPDQRLVDLVADMTHQQTYSTIVASALIAAALLLTAVLVPFMTLFAIHQHERKRQPPPATQQLTNLQPREALPPAQRSLPQNQEVSPTPMTRKNED